MCSCPEPISPCQSPCAYATTQHSSAAVPPHLPHPCVHARCIQPCKARPEPWHAVCSDFVSAQAHSSSNTYHVTCLQCNCTSLCAITPDRTSCDSTLCGVGCVTQVLKFIGEVLADTRQQEALCPEPAELHMLWQILQLLCHHKGDFRSADVAAAKLNAARPGGLPYKCSLQQVVCSTSCQGA